MSSPATIPEISSHCDESQAEQNTASSPASANPVQCGGPDGSPATTRNCGVGSEVLGRLRSASSIQRLNLASHNLGRGAGLVDRVLVRFRHLPHPPQIPPRKLLFLAWSQVVT